MEKDKKQKIRFDYNYLYNFCNENNLKLVREYSNVIVTRETLIEVKCVGENCENICSKKLVNLVKNKNFGCVNCLSKIKTLKTKNTTLIQKYEIQVNQLKEISEKEKLYNKNSKMLQIVQSRNSFKRKIISTLIASIFFFLIITIATFVYYKRTLK